MHVSLEGLHTGGMVEASDVRGYERRKHRSKSIPRRLRRAYLSRITGPPRRERALRDWSVRTGPEGVSVARASAVARFIVSAPANSEGAPIRLAASLTERDLRSDEARTLPRPTTVTAMAATAGASRIETRTRRRTRPMSIVRSSLSGGAVRSSSVNAPTELWNSLQDEHSAR